MTTRLAGLVRRELIRPDRAQLAGDDGYRFRHLLIRDAAYDALPKAVRSDLHVRFAAWLDEHGHALVERDEIVGYHLEQAVRYQAELGQPDPSSPNVQPCGSPPLAGARTTAWTSGRRPRFSLGRRARATASARCHARARGRMGDRRVRRRAAVQAADAVSERAEVAGDRSGAMLCRAMALFNRMFAGEVVERRAGGALPCSAPPRGGAGRSTAARDPLGDARPRREFRMQNDDDVHASGRLSATASSPETPRVRHAGLEWPLILGPCPADEAMRMLDELVPGSPRETGTAAGSSACDARAYRRSVAARRGAVASPAGGHGQCSARGEHLSAIASIQGDRERACRHNAEMIEVMAGGVASAASGRCSARELCYLGRVEEAEPARRAQAVAAGPVSRVMAPAAEALLLAARGELEQAEALACTASTGRRPRRTTSGSRHGRAKTSPPCSSARAGSTTHARRWSAPSRCGSGSAACRSRVVSVSRSTRLGVRRSDGTNGWTSAHRPAVSTSPGEGSVMTRGKDRRKNCLQIAPPHQSMGM